jgi:hypothetical protein
MPNLPSPKRTQRVGCQTAASTRSHSWPLARAHQGVDGDEADDGPGDEPTVRAGEGELLFDVGLGLGES